MKNVFKNNYDWKRLKRLNSLGNELIDGTGIYVYLEVPDGYYGIPISMKPVYVGMSNKISRRHSEHIGLNESNYELRKWIRSRNEGFNKELWFTRVHPQDLREVESHLISIMNPIFNRVGKKALSA